MRIGLTYDLREAYLAAGHGEEATAEFDSPETIEAIARAIAARGHEVVRIGHLAELAARLVAGERFDLVFNIAEGLHGLAREAQVPALLEAWRIPVTFSDALTMALTLDKGMAKRVVRDHGIPTAAFAVVDEPSAAADLDLGFPLFVKPLAEGTGKGIGSASRVDDQATLVAQCRALLARFDQPVLVEHYLPGRELTVGILGTGRDARILGVMEIVLGERALADGYGFETKEHYEDRVGYRLVEGAEAKAAGEVALAAWRALRCRDGGRVDLKSDADGRPHFLEVNPLAGLHPIRSDLVILAGLAGMSHDGLIGAILDCALQRLGVDADARPLKWAS